MRRCRIDAFLQRIVEHIDSRVGIVNGTDHLNIIDVVSLFQSIIDNGKDIAFDVGAWTVKKAHIFVKHGKIRLRIMNLMGKRDHITAFFLTMYILKPYERKPLCPYQITENRSRRYTRKLILITDNAYTLDSL